MLNNFKVHSSLSSLISRFPKTLTRRIDDSEDDADSLSLAYENLNHIPHVMIHQYGETIKVLDVSNNNISVLNFLIYFKNLDSFIADHNPISDLTVLPFVPKLKLLWLNYCLISKLYPFIKELRRSCPMLEHLSLMGNDAAPSYLNGATYYRYFQYRLFVISKFHMLIHLDDRSVTKDQRAIAEGIHKRSSFEEAKLAKDHRFPFSIPLENDSRFNCLTLHSKMADILNKTNINPGSLGNLFELRILNV